MIYHVFRSHLHCERLPSVLQKPTFDSAEGNLLWYREIWNCWHEFVSLCKRVLCENLQKYAIFPVAPFEFVFTRFSEGKNTMGFLIRLLVAMESPSRRLRAWRLWPDVMFAAPHGETSASMPTGKRAKSLDFRYN